MGFPSFFLSRTLYTSLELIILAKSAFVISECDNLNPDFSLAYLLNVPNNESNALNAL